MEFIKMKNKSFNLIFKGNAINTGSMRNDIDVIFESMDERFQLATDEGAFHGGKGTAPPPLALFTASLCGCVMTQIKAFGKKLNIQVSEIKIDATMEWNGTITDEGPYLAECKGYNLDIDIISNETLDRKKKLLNAAIKGCFIEASLKPGLVKHRLKNKDNWISV
jgi:uncharacterized OsmC-like protein|tara:strand:- start:2425 stop:2919 length:495 start_codon:yes stop_codon:yes gene_type:complete